MDIETLKNMVTEDCKVDNTLLDSESLKTPNIHAKYMNFLLDEGILMKKFVRQKKELERALTEYYAGRADESMYERKGQFNLKVLKTDIKDYVESDCEYLELQEKIDLCEEKIKYLEQIIRQINNRNFAIKNAIDWRRFSNGLN